MSGGQGLLLLGEAETRGWVCGCPEKGHETCN